ncbi:hypothetical protein IB274_02615 [Pseudomonas sp. PDM18]|uniref:hypothetical protein n=1 Tax=Pseudomonas sp. PDM18 TaxID=2769253 RepID=UPI0017844B9C|nr:hypothetical protein [Pseudomonas sp. PDM18]MBD9675572.1 hypothetical protein [Pseudomonas sp. PDM18]
MTEQQACTLCGAGGHTAAQCNWNTPLELLREYEQHGHSEGWWHKVTAFLASKQDEQRAEFRRHLSECAAEVATWPAYKRDSLGVIINGHQLRNALEFLAPDNSAEQLGENLVIELHAKDDDFPVAGLYAYHSECPEEGAIFLDDTAQHPEQAEGAQGEREDWSAFDDGIDWSCFPGYLIDHCEGDTITEEGLQFALSAMLKDDDYLRIQSEKARVALAQPSPAPELERPEVVGYCDPNHIQRMRDDQISGYMVHDEKGVYTCEPLMTVAQHKRIQAAWKERVRSTYVDLTRRNNELIVERDATQARVAELEAWFKLYNERQKLAENFPDDPVAQAGQVPDALREAIKWADHLLFECGALVQTRAPSVHVYNQTYAAVEAAKAMLAAAPAQGENDA